MFSFLDDFESYHHLGALNLFFDERLRACLQNCGRHGLDSLCRNFIECSAAVMLIIVSQSTCISKIDLNFIIPFQKRFLHTMWKKTNLASNIMAKLTNPSDSFFENLIWTDKRLLKKVVKLYFFPLSLRLQISSQIQSSLFDTNVKRSVLEIGIKFPTGFSCFHFLRCLAWCTRSDLASVRLSSFKYAFFSRAIASTCPTWDKVMCEHVEHVCIFLVENEWQIAKTIIDVIAKTRNILKRTQSLWYMDRRRINWNQPHNRKNCNDWIHWAWQWEVFFFNFFVNKWALTAWQSLREKDAPKNSKLRL